MKKGIFYYLLLLFITGCTSAKIFQPTIKGGITGLRLLDEYLIPHSLRFDSTVVGGLSGIDYDPATGNYYLICDDRSQFNPARFYVAQIPIKNEKIDTVQFITYRKLTNPGTSAIPFRGSDPEAIRINPVSRELIWSSEGERTVSAARTVYQDPFIRVMDSTGKQLRDLTLPANLQIRKEELGPRDNGVFEGVTFADNYKNVYVSVEEPLYEDGPRAATGDSIGFVRIIKFDYRTGKQVAQFAYHVDPVVHPANPPGSYKINGISDMMYVGGDRFIIIERSYSTGHPGCTIKLYLASLSRATDVSHLSSLKENIAIRPISKRLLLNMDSLGRHIDNVEGVTFGPNLSNGHQSLLLIVDDNFSKAEPMQVFLFEIIP